MPARASSACASAAASAPASARPAGAAARARRRAPACVSAASKAARCRCIGACPSAASTSCNRKVYNEINLGRLQAAIDAGALDGKKPVDAAALRAAGLIRRPHDGVRLLGEGELKASLQLTVNHATASAKAAVEKAGGSIKLIVKKVLPADEAKRKKTAAKKAKAVKGETRGERRIEALRRGGALHAPAPDRLPGVPVLGA